LMMNVRASWSPSEWGFQKMKPGDHDRYGLS
jgi:hypothetical protein